MNLITSRPHTTYAMKRLPNFSISARSSVSSWFIEKNISDFYSAIQHLKILPTTISNSPCQLANVVREGGSNNAKIALLAALARENYHSEIKLVLCTYAENFQDKPLVQCVLQNHNLPAIPEVGCYLKYNGNFYFPLGESSEEIPSIISDIEITQQQVGSFTRRYYRHFVEHWLQLEKLHHCWTVDAIRKVKMECSQVLENHPWQTAQPPFKA